MHTPVSVVVISASEIVTAGLEQVLRARSEVELKSADPTTTSVDVVVYDASGLEQDDGSELEDLCRSTSSAVVVVGRATRPDLAARARSRGAAATFDLEAAPDELVATVVAVSSGAADPTPPAEGPLAATGLTPREIDVLGAITRGLTNEELGRELFLTHNTVKSYIRAAYSKIGVRSRSQAVVWCLLHGFDPK